MTDHADSEPFDNQAALFREEAIAARRPSLEGHIVILGHKWLAYTSVAIFVALAIAGVLIASAAVPRIEQAPGWLTTTKGLIEIQSLRSGVVDEIRVREGQTVRSGDVLATIRLEQMQLDIGGTPERVLLQSIDEQDKRLLDQIDVAFLQAETDERRLKDTLVALKEQGDALRVELAQAREIESISDKNAAVGEALLKQGAYSRREVWADQTDRSQKLLNIGTLKERLSEVSAQLVVAQSELQRLPMDRDAKVAELQAERAALHQKLAETQELRSYALTAPVDGRIASVIARPGYPADGRHALITLIPAGARLTAQLFVPSSAIGFVKVGEGVRLLYDAFPYQRFGSRLGQVTAVSRSALLPGEVAAPVEIKEPVYLVDVALQDDSLSAFGRRTPLQAGMTLSADIVLERRSVFEWLLEPLFAVQGRR